MPDLSIELTPQEHEKLRAGAATRRQSVEEYAHDLLVAGQDMDDIEAAQRELNDFLQERLKNIDQAKFVTADDIKKAARERLKARS